LRGRTADRGQVRQFAPHFDRLEQVARQREAAVDAFVHVVGADLAAVEAAEVAQVADQPRDLLDAVQAVSRQGAQVLHGLSPAQAGYLFRRARKLLPERFLAFRTLLEHPDQAVCRG